jgi:hypothetical protein
MRIRVAHASISLRLFDFELESINKKMKDTLQKWVSLYWDKESDKNIEYF